MATKPIKILTEQKTNLIVCYRGQNQFFFDTLRDFEKVIIESKRGNKILRDEKIPSFLGEASYCLYRGLSLTLFRGKQLPLLSNLIGNNGHYLALLMGAKLRQCFPYFSYARRKSVYLFDAWESSHQLIQEFVKNYAIDNTFISSLQVVERFRLKNPSGGYHWIPEGISPEEYYSVDYNDKDIDVLQMGRRYDSYHEKIVNQLEEKDYSYIYQKNKGNPIFPSRAIFSNTLARSKISICVTADITHPERTRQIKTMTNRYLQSMASKCLIVGSKPPEFDALFDYEPMIEIDNTDPVGQLQEILSNYNQFIPLIERNYEAVRKEHSWSQRWEMMQSLMDRYAP